MGKTAQNIIDRALTLVDEIVTEFDALASTEASLSEVAAKILPEVCRSLVKDLPYELKKYLEVSPSSAPDLDIRNDDDFKQVVEMDLPSDFWELVSVKLTSWDRSVNDYINEDSPGRAIQSNPYSRSDKYNPACVVFSSGDDKKLGLYSIKKGETPTLEHFKYVSFDNVPTDTGTPIEWPDELFDEITKALALELNTIKDRLQQAQVKAAEVEGAISQHN